MALRRRLVPRLLPGRRGDDLFALLFLALFVLVLFVPVAADERK